MVKTAGVLGLNLILIQMKGETKPAPVAKHRVGGPGEVSVLGNTVKRSWA